MSKDKSSVGAIMESMAATIKATVASMPSPTVGKAPDGSAVAQSPDAVKSKQASIVADVVSANAAALVEAAKADLS